MSETLNTTEERQMLDAVKRAVDLVEKGSSPDDAIEKIARDEGYGPGKIRLVAHAYNNGRQLSQWNNGSNVLDKLASFPLADPQRIIDRVYNGPTAQEKAARDAVDPDYHFPPSWLENPRLEKKARAPLPLPASAPLEPYARDPMEDLHKAYGNVQREKQAAEEASRLASKAEDDVRMKVAALVTYFKQANYARIPFEHCEHACRSYFGNASIPLLEMVYKQARLREKRASDVMPVLKTGLNMRAEPFTIIREAIKAAEECSRLRMMAGQKKEKAQQVKEGALRPFSKAGESRPSAQPSSVPTPGLLSRTAAGIFQTKQAMGFGTEVAAIAMGDIAGQAIHHRIDPLMQQEHGSDHSKEEEEIGFDDAEEQDEIGSIRKRVALDTMLADPKNPLSKLPAPDVVSAYNNIVKGNPQLADNPAELQPLLEGHFGSKIAPKQVTALDKMAVIDLAVPMAMGMAGRSIGDVPKPKSELIDDKWMELEDPHHANELRKIKAHTLLTQLLTDQDDPISGHDPDKVLSAYNELSAASPRVADNIHTLRPALRRKLEGNQEPFEAKELLDIEKGLAATRLPTPATSALQQGPDKLLG